MGSCKVALVTGGAQGLGKAFAEYLLNKSFKVALLDVNSSVGTKTCIEFQKRYGNDTCIFIQCDVSDMNKLKEAILQVKKHYKQINVMVNNAGIVDEMNWQKMMLINTNAVIEGTYIGVELMRKDRGGEGGIIVNIASTAGLTMVPATPVYAASKHAVVGFSRSTASAVKAMESQWGVSILCLCPAFTDTAIIQLTPKTTGSPVINDIVLERNQKGMDALGIMKIAEVVNAFDKLLQENINGAVLSVTKFGMKYHLQKPSSL